jgi:L-alanine-DL-glutamate epimerase-like enolase superfamily enzyme
VRIDRVEAFYVRYMMERLQAHVLVPTQVDHGALIVKLSCDDGTVGVGRTYGGSVFASHAVKASVEKDFAPLLLGENPLDAGRLFQKLEVFSHYHGRAGVAFSAVSALDIALWDILGKACGQPLYRLLGAVRDSVPVYASEGWVYLEPDELAEKMRTRIDEGYPAVKLRLPQDRAMCVRKMRAVRDALGEDVPIMVDVQNAWENVSISVRNTSAIEEYRPFWIEEPVMVQDLDGHHRVGFLTGVPIAGGEHIYSKHQFREAFSKDAFGYAQPDAFRVGGITELQKVIGMAESWFVPVVPHGAYEVHRHVALSHAASSVPYVELLTDSEAPLLKIIYNDFDLPEGGLATVPDRPGLGVELNEKAIAEYMVKESI